ncbi:MAG: redox-regulated ATPase YchF [bacterium]
MGFNCGLVGLPNAGKSTIFNALTNLGVDASAYPFCTIDPHFGIIVLEDERLDMIYSIIGSAKKSPTNLEFIDIAGLIKGAHHGEGLGNQFLSHITQCDAIAHVVRCFEDENVSHPYEHIDPVNDAKSITTEIILKDIEITESHLKQFQQAAKSGDSEAKKKIGILHQFLDHLNAEKEIRTLQLTPKQAGVVRELNLLSAKPVMYIANIDEDHLTDSSLVKELSEYAEFVHSPCIPFCGKVQEEIAELDHDEQLEFLQAMGLDETGLQKIVRTGYNLLYLITFFTANENEAHAWTIGKGTTVVQAAEKVHTDFAKGFIRAEVIKYPDLIEYKSTKILHEKGLIAVHGRDYTVEDGDLIFFHARK